LMSFGSTASFAHVKVPFSSTLFSRMKTTQRFAQLSEIAGGSADGDVWKCLSGLNDYIPVKNIILLKMRRVIKWFLLSIPLGLVGLAASSTREPWGVWQGFPFAYSYANPITCLPNPFNGCGFYYDPVMFVLDYLFWLGIAVVGLSVISKFWNRLVQTGVSRQPKSSNRSWKNHPSK
jgi:hypothetical protein